MSASKNSDAMTAAQGEFSSRVRPSEPLTTKGHAPGVLVGNEKLPEFNVEAYPPGTAPSSRTFQPAPTDQVPSQASGARASDTIQGATSADVHQGLGHPGCGMTSQELHGTRKGEGAGLEGVGANVSDPIHQQGADRDYETAKQGKWDAKYPGAQDREPASADAVGSERR